MTELPRPLGRRIEPMALPALITPAQATYLGMPPKPYPPEVQLIMSNGRPSDDYHRLLTYEYEWRLRLVNVLLGGP